MMRMMDRRSRRRVRRRLAAALQAIGIGLGLVLIPRLSRRQVWRLGAWLGLAAYRLDRRGRRVTEANLDLVYGDRLSAVRRRALGRISYRHVARVLLDIFWFSRHRESRLQRWCSMDTSVKERLRQTPGFLLTAHLGNWEIAGQALSSAGVPLASVVKPIGSLRTTARLNQVRGATGQGIVPREGAVRGMVRALRNGCSVAVLQDQHTDVEDGGVFVDFLGCPAAVSSAVATLSIRMQVPVYVGMFLHNARGFYHARLSACMVLAPELPVAAATQQLTDALTVLIRRYPGQWLWMYRRWKRIPPGVAPSRFPFYAHKSDAADSPRSADTDRDSPVSPPGGRRCGDADAGSRVVAARGIRSGRGHPRLMMRLVVVLILALVVVLLHTHPLVDWFQDVDAMRRAMERWSVWAPFWIFLGTAVLIALGFSRAVLNGLSGLLLGALMGFVVAHGATMLGNALQYSVLRWFRRDMRRSPGSSIPVQENAPDRSRIRKVILIRLMPVSAVFHNLALLRARVTWKEFLLGTLVGGLPSTVVAVTVGAGLGEASLVEAVLPILFAAILVLAIMRLVGSSVPLDTSDSESADA